MSAAALDSAGPSSSRVDWLDVAKGIGIALLVVGHVLRGLVSAHVLSSGGWAFRIDRFIYSFHMPLFFFVAGALLPRSLARPPSAFVKTRLAQLAYPYLLWAPAQTLLQHATSRYTNHGAQVSSWLAIAYAPPMQLWFLYALLLGSLLLAALWYLGLRSKGLAIVALIVLLTERWIPLGPWQILYPTRHYFVPLAVGASLAASGRIWSISAVSRRVLVGAGVLGFGVVAGVVARGYSSEDARPTVAAAVASAGVLATLALGRLLASHRGRGTALLRQMGEQSLAVFVAHTIAAAGARILLQRGLHVQSATIHVIAGVTVGIGGPLLLARAATRLGVPLFRLERRASPSSTRPRVIADATEAP